MTTATDTQPAPAPAPQTTPAIAACAVDVVKTYGRGEAAVRALDFALDSARVAIPAGHAELTGGH